MDKLTRFIEHGREFQDALSQIPEAHRNISVDGGWSAAFVVHHVVDAELHFASRYLHAIGDHQPKIVPFDEESYPELVQYAKRKVKTSLAALVGIRALAYEVLANATDADWLRISHHPDLGDITLEQLFEKGDSHMVSHTAQLKEIAGKF